ncbi:antitermination protein NusG [Rhizobium sp. Leaf383]|nr:antitermination protein NusG [Rhizobium sp. Leaf383]
MIESELTNVERTRAYAGQARIERYARIAATQLREASRTASESTGRRAQWFCLHVEKGHEATVEGVLDGADVEVFLPKEKIFRVVRGKKISGEYPIIAGYILVRIAPSAAAFQSLKRQKHVIDIVGGPYGYHVVIDQDVAKLQALTQAPAAVRMATDKTFRQGDKAEIIIGPFAGFLCVVTAVKWCREARAKVMIDLLGKVFEIESMPLAFLQKL